MGSEGEETVMARAMAARAMANEEVKVAIQELRRKAAAWFERRERTLGRTPGRASRTRPLADLLSELRAREVQGPISSGAPVDGNLKNAAGKAKAQIQLFPAAGIIVGTDAMTEGAAKYGAFNWRTGSVEMLQYLRAIEAHCLAMIDGEDIDPESATGKSHLSGILASAAIIADAIEVGVLVDDRVPGFAGRMLRERAGA